MNTGTIKSITKNKHFQIGVVSVFSAVAGGAGGYFFAKKRLRPYYEEISNREIAEAKEFYGRLHKNDDENDSPEKVMERLHGSAAVEALQTYQGGHPVHAPVATEADLMEEFEPKVVKITEAIEIVEEKHNVFADSSPIESGNFNYEEEVPLRSGEKPYIITHDEFYEGEKDYEQITLTYFDGDDVLVDEQDQPVDDPEDTIGEDHLVRFGHGSKDNNVVYVRNDRIEADFEISRSFGKYAEEVLGFIEHGDRHGLRKFREYDE